MDKEQLQLTATKGKGEKFSLAFRKGDKELKLESCTKDELRMIKEVINKII